MASTMLLNKSQSILAGRTTSPRSMAVKLAPAPHNLRSVVAWGIGQKEDKSLPTPDSPRSPPDLQKVREQVSNPDDSPLQSPVWKAEQATTAPYETTGTKVKAEDAVAFDGPVPEAFNGRMAMLGFTAAMLAELRTGEPLLDQFGHAALPIIATVAIFGLASIVPVVRGSRLDKAFGPFTPQAELINGRAAMIGIAAMLIIEAIKGRAIF